MVKLYEMWSAIGGPKSEEEQDIDWMDDLKFFIDNNNQLLSQHILPASAKQKENPDHPDCWKHYVKPVRHAIDEYCEVFELENRDEIFTKDKIVEMCKLFADEQSKHIEQGHYDKKKYESL